MHVDGCPMPQKIGLVILMRNIQYNMVVLTAEMHEEV